MFRRLEITRAILTLPVVLLSSAAPVAVPKRIISLNLCADQLVIALADPFQIAGLTEWARDPALSYYAARARNLPYTKRSAEEVMELRPDVVIGAPFRAQSALAALKLHGLRLVAMPKKDGYTGLAASITTVANAVGHPERGRALIARIEGELARLSPPPGRNRVAAYYQRQGYLTGTGTLVDDMMRRAGLINLAGQLGRSSVSRLGIEQLALSRPDFLITETGARSADDRGAELLRHPLLGRVVPPPRHLYVHQALTVCATPGYPRAVASLIRQVRAADAHATR